MAATRYWTFRVVCSVASGETVCVVGSPPQLGSWDVDGVVELKPADHNSRQEAEDTPQQVNGCFSSPWTAGVTLRSDTEVRYRYCVCVIVHAEGERKVIVRRWETDIVPRKISVQTLQDESKSAPEERFGYITPIAHEDRGWLNAESVVQLKLYNNPFEIWKKRVKKYRLKVTPVDLAKKMNRKEPQFAASGEDSSEMDMHSVRNGNTWPIMELAVMADGEQKFGVQQQFGRLYEPDDFLVFQCQMLKPDTIAYMVDFYTEAENEDGLAEHVGFCHILPTNLKQTIDTVALPIIGRNQQPIGQLKVEYLLVRPMVDTKCSMESSFSRYWRETWRGLDVGHRGAGSSFTHDSSVCANIRENTIASLKRAMEHGADFVEFDIQLSKDMVPLIYHDFHVSIALRKRHTVNDHDLLTVPLKQLDYAQLQKLQVYNVEEGQMGSDHLEDDQLTDTEPFPTLQLAMETLDPHVGFNIEIKWTMQLKDGSFELYHPFELNSYIDHILRVVFAHSGTRKIIFSCFHPDICTMLRLKQNRYPVLFLTQGETTLWPPYLDTRTQTLQMAALFAECAQILGVNVFSGVLLQQPAFIKQAQARGLVVFCWGDDNANSDTIRFLKSQGCDGIIYDRVDKYCTKETKESIFLLESRQALEMKLPGVADTGSDTSDTSDPPAAGTASVSSGC